MYSQTLIYTDTHTYASVHSYPLMTTQAHSYSLVHTHTHTHTHTILTSVSLFPAISLSRIVVLPSHFCMCSIFPSLSVTLDCRHKDVMGQGRDRAGDVLSVMGSVSERLVYRRVHLCKPMEVVQ